ncbi:MAG: YhfC family intramembrane metalloprotease [Clostridiales bacterium]|jgi:uncharacterized membrane protein YhfC|nr:YhfC family intramembrane metalloprotease [Clostridiales bacterium]
MGKVPALSIVCLGVSVLIDFGFPMILFIFFRKKFGAKVVPMAFGVAGFIVFALILESLLHTIVLRRDENGVIALLGSPFLYTLYGTMAAGVFEETARFLSFLFLKKKYAGVGTGLAYGVGHGGAEAILVAGLPMISNLALSVMINFNIGGITEMLGDLPQAADGISQLISTPSYLFLISGVERVGAIAIQISLSVLVWYAVCLEGKRWLYPAAVLLHALVDVPAALMQTGVLTSIVLVEGFVYAAAAVLIVLAAAAYKKWEPRPAPIQS